MNEIKMRGVRNMAFDWETTALTLLEKNLNGDTLNADSLKEIFPSDILEELDIRDDGNEVEDIDKALYGGRPQIIEIREAKPTEVYHCNCCNRSFKRRDNFKRHMLSALHQRRMRALEMEALAAKHEKETDAINP